MEKNIKRIVAVVIIAFLCVSGALTTLTHYKQIGASFYYGMKDSESAGVLNKVESGIKAAESSVNENFYFRTQAVSLHGLVQRVMQKSVVDDVDENYTVLKLNNGYLSFLEKGTGNYTFAVQFLSELNKVCKNNNASLVYVNKLQKNISDVSVYPNNYPYLYTGETKGYLDELRAMGIGVLDLEDSIARQNKDVFSMFYKTDHHWTPQAGIWASGQITEYLNNSYGYTINTDIYSEENYNVEVYENSFLGSQGKRVGPYYGGVEDFCIVTPKYDTNYTLSLPQVNIYREGTFEETMLFRERFTPDDIMNQEMTAYQVYLRGNNGIVSIENHTADNDSKALVIMDSYGCVVAPFLCQSFGRLDCIDLRHFDGNLQEYIEEMSPDVVICMTTKFTPVDE